MSEQEGRSRTRRRFTLRRIRLINFHNFVDETIEVPDGGHLFLLGDNGSGKTTIIDAIHYVLSGGQELDWNAAARLGVKRDGGRSIQGVVLRYDAERGVVNESGAIAYAVIELEDCSLGEKLCIGIGTEATTLEARVTRWGVVRRCALEELPILLTDTAGPPRPSTRELLRDRLGRTDLYGQLTDYRKALAERLFGSLELYEEVCRFWAMAKAYREIVTGARDFETLFSRLLPAPDAGVLGDIVRSLSEIDELEVALRELDFQKTYVEGLVDLSGRVAAHREAIARYQWLDCYRRLERTRADQDRLALETSRQLAELSDLEVEVRSSSGRVEAAEEAVRAALAADPDGLLGAIRNAEANLAERQGEAERRQSEAAREKRILEEAAEVAARTRHGFGASLNGAAHAVARSIDDFGIERPSLEAVERAVTEALAAATTDAALPAAPPSVCAEALSEVGAIEGALQDTAREKKRAADEARQALDGGRHELATLEATSEECPDARGFGELVDALAAEQLEARPVYELVETVPGANPKDLAALEALAGVETLAAFVASDQDLERARTIAQERAPGLRVLVRTAPEAALPAWAERLFVPPEEPLAKAALSALAAALCQPSSLGEIRPANDDSGLELRGLAFRAAGVEPRLLGREARLKQHRLRVAAHREVVVRLEQACSRATHDERQARHRVERVGAVRRAVDALRSRELQGSWAEALKATQAEEHARTSEEAARGRATEAADRAADAASLAEALRAKAAGKNLEELEARIDELRGALGLARQKHDAIVKRHGRAEKQLDDLGEEASANAAQADRIAQELAIAGGKLRSHLPSPMEDEALSRYVRVQQRGDSFKSDEAVRARLDEAQRAEQSAREELAGDGSKGVRYLPYAARFGFSYDADSNRLEDRRQTPASGVLKQLGQDVAEQRGVVNEKTRVLMDTLVMGALARHLQEQVERLRRMVTDINRLLEGLRFGTTQYQFVVKPKDDRRELVELVRRLSLLDEESRRRFRCWIDEHVADLKAGSQGETPELLDYRRWYDYSLRMKGATPDGVELRRELRALGSGGEQGVPNYLLVLSLAKLMFDSAQARLRPLLFDEAFYGIDQGRRDQLLRFATELGLQLFVASPDQDGATSAVRYATTLFIVRDDNADVHLAPYHYWNHASRPQQELFDTRAPSEPDEAECKL